jgi:hypothetical protein
MMHDDDRRLDAAVSLGILSADQAAAIRALTPERSKADGHVPASAAASLGYFLGALTVIIAMGWFLADRWEWLGAWGVLVVVALYATLFLYVARRLRNENQPVAAGVLVLLAVLLTPLVVTAVNEITGWMLPRGTNCYGSEFVLWACRGEELVMELATVAVALFALRRVRFPLLVAPIAGIALRMLFHAADTLVGIGYGGTTAGWIWVAGASLMTSAAYVTEREQPDGEDYAFWLHLTGAICAGIASGILLGATVSFRHLLIPGALVALFFALRMRRVVWQLLGLTWFAGYLAWLASDVFDDTPFFPIVLAALGVGVIIATVWLQRNSARLSARFGALGSDGRPTFPGGVTLMLAPLVAVLIQMPIAVALDRAERADAEANHRAYRAREDRRERDARAAGAERQETTPRRRP